MVDDSIGPEKAENGQEKGSDLSRESAASHPELRPEKTVDFDRVNIREIEDEMESSYIDYAMSVIVGRALPDVRDGLKPVHRRVLFTMLELGLLHNKPFKKSARIVGDCLGKYHPHGDTAVYDTLVRMAQDFSLRYPLVNGQGNFGSIDHDAAAAMRYTEARLSRIAEEMLVDIDKETVDFVPNFDGSMKEPSLLPARIPNLLVNGSSGIAVGMATNIPPHNISEIISAVAAFIDDNEIPVENLMKLIKGPDFPTGGIIYGTAGIRSAYKYGRGKIVIKAKTEIEVIKDRQKIIITEIPYQVSKAQLVEDIANLVRDKRIAGISDIRDESDREGMRVVIELKKDATSAVVLNQLYAYSNMTYSFGVNMVALVDNKPVTLNLKDLIRHFVRHRQAVVRKRTEFELRKAKERNHILEGLIIALNNIDEIVAKIKKSKAVEDAKIMLMEDYDLSEIQAKAVLDMKLQKLSSLEQDAIRKEQEELLRLIRDLQDILASEQKILSIIKKELSEIMEKYGDSRRTEIDYSAKDEDQAVDVENLIKEEEMAVTVSHTGYIKRIPLTEYRQQHRGGRGVIAAETKDEDFIEHLFVASTHAYILLFTNKGNVHWLKVHQIPEATRYSKGKSIMTLAPLEKDERISAFIPVTEFEAGKYLVLATKNGTVKKTDLLEYSRPRQGGIIAITLEEGDDLVNAVLTDGEQQILLASADGKAVKFHERDARPIGRTSKGVRGILLRDSDYVVGMQIAKDSETLLTLTENGFGKRTSIAEYRLISRGGSGVINIQCSDRNGKVVAVSTVTDDDEVMFISKNGIVIRTAASGISVIGRNTQGLRLMRLEEGDKVMDMAKIAKE